MPRLYSLSFIFCSFFFFLFLHTFSSGVGKGFHSNNKTENMVLSNSVVFCGFLGQANPLTFCVCIMGYGGVLSVAL